MGEKLTQQKISELFLNNIYVLPLWVKQVIHLRTREKLKEELADFMELLSPEGLYQNYIPKLTFKGRRELEQRTMGLPEDYYTFFSNLTEDFDIFEITLTNYWTIAETSKIFARSVELELVEVPNIESHFIVAQYLAGRLRTGELLKRLGKISVNQLEKAIREQRELNKDGNHRKIVEVMISLGFITHEDVDILLAFKEESKRRFIMNLGLSTLKLDGTDMTEKQMLVNNMQKEMKKLNHENNILKTRLRKLLNIQE